MIMTAKKSSGREKTSNRKTSIVGISMSEIDLQTLDIIWRDLGFATRSAYVKDLVRQDLARHRRAAKAAK